MTTTKPDVDLAGIRARADAATAEPWEADENVPFNRQPRVSQPHPGRLIAVVGNAEDAFERQEHWEADAAFIAHARADIPALLDLVDAQRAEIARLTASASSGRNAGEVENWLEREFGGHGVAIRKQSDPEIPGEPFMSMEVAKDITRRAITATLETRDLAHAGREEQMRKALEQAREVIAYETNGAMTLTLAQIDAALAEQPASPTGETT